MRCGARWAATAWASWRMWGCASSTRTTTCLTEVRTAQLKHTGQRTESCQAGAGSLSTGHALRSSSKLHPWSKLLSAGRVSPGRKGGGGGAGRSTAEEGSANTIATTGACAVRRVLMGRCGCCARALRRRVQYHCVQDHWQPHREERDGWHQRHHLCVRRHIIGQDAYHDGGWRCSGVGGGWTGLQSRAVSKHATCQRVGRARILQLMECMECMPGSGTCWHNVQSRSNVSNQLCSSPGGGQTAGLGLQSGGAALHACSAANGCSGPDHWAAATQKQCRGCTWSRRSPCGLLC